MFETKLIVVMNERGTRFLFTYPSRIHISPLLAAARLQDGELKKQLDCYC